MREIVKINKETEAERKSACGCRCAIAGRIIIVILMLLTPAVHLNMHLNTGILFINTDTIQ